jgi:hypothetical protein
MRKPEITNKMSTPTKPRVMTIGKSVIEHY